MLFVVRELQGFSFQGWWNAQSFSSVFLEGYQPVSQEEPQPGGCRWCFVLLLVRIGWVGLLWRSHILASS